MVESKTLSKKSEISYYRIFGWRKVGEYHGPSLMGTESLVSTDGKLMLKDKIVDEYYIQRDMSDSRYKSWIENEHNYRKYYDLAKKTEIEAREVKQNKNRKALKATFVCILLVAIAALVFFLTAMFIPQLMGQNVELFEEEWNQYASILAMLAGFSFVLMIVSSIIIHKNRARPLERLLNSYRNKYLNAYKDAATSNGLAFEEGNMVEPLRFKSPNQQPTAN